MLSDEDAFDAVDAAFKAMAAGRRRILKHEFIDFLQKPSDGSDSLRKVFNKIDADGDGSISNLELLASTKVIDPSRCPLTLDWNGFMENVTKPL